MGEEQPCFKDAMLLGSCVMRFIHQFKTKDKKLMSYLFDRWKLQTLFHNKHSHLNLLNESNDFSASDRIQIV